MNSMKKVAIIAVATLFLLTLFAGTVSARSDNVQKIDIPKEWQGKSQIILQKGDFVQVVWIKRVDGDNDPNAQTGRYKPPTSSEYSLASYRWKLPKYKEGVPYALNPSGVSKLGSAVTQAVSGSLNTWNDATEAQSRPVTVFAAAPMINWNAQVEPTSAGRPDYQNVISWASLGDNNVIAMSTMWYNSLTRELVDADMVFNTYFKWGIDKDGEGTLYSVKPSTFDIQNIGTHEAGHVFGLGDIYDGKYSEMTMYGYGAFGEVKKISLDGGDVAGIQAIFGQ